jgi:DNA-binding beta-propeller fold protein YncE
MNRRASALAVLAALAAFGLLRVDAQERTGSIEIALVANAEGGTVALVDVASRALVGAIDVNPARLKSVGPGAPNFAQDTDVSPDGRTVYVSRGYLGDVAAFDLTSGRLLWQRPLDTGRADHMTLSPDGRSLFVSAMMDDRVYRVATATGEITGQVITGVYPHDNKISKDGTRVYNSSLGVLAAMPRPAGAKTSPDTPAHPFQLTIADASTLQVRERIPLETAFRPWQFSPDGGSIYAQLSNQHAVIAYDLAARKVSRRLELPMKPGITPKDWDFEAPHHGLALTEDGKTLCLAGRASDYAALVSAPDLTLLATVPVGDGPGWSEVDTSGRTCFIANARSDELSIISIAERREVVRLPVGNGPKHITVARLPASVIASVKARPSQQ